MEILGDTITNTISINERVKDDTVRVVFNEYKVCEVYKLL